MDVTTLLILGGIALAIAVAALFALRRAWGDFPDRASTPPPVGPSAPGASPPPSMPTFDAPIAPAPLAEPPPGLVPIEHPMMRRAAEAALERGSSAARYIVRAGDQLYFSFDQISDPAQRQAAYDLMRRFIAGEDVDIQAMSQLVRQLFGQELKDKT